MTSAWSPMWTPSGSMTAADLQRPADSPVGAAGRRRRRLRDPVGHPGGHHPGHDGGLRCGGSGPDRNRRRSAFRSCRRSTRAVVPLRRWSWHRTRELALQVAEAFGAHLPEINDGGSSYGPQLAGLKRGAQVVVGTPGGVIDHLEKGGLDLSRLDYLVLDEADEMLQMGFSSRPVHPV